MMPQVVAAARNAEELLRNGEPLLAYDAIEQALDEWPGDCRLRQLRGLALARSGALRRANQELQSLREAGCIDGETLGLLARTHKDLALAAPEGPSRDKHLAAAFEIYSVGYRESVQREAVDDGYYTGINAATMALLLGDRDSARRIAKQVEELCRRAIQEHGEDSGNVYWPTATLAEAALIRGERDTAQERYAAAAALAGRRYGDLSSTRHQARLLLEHLGDSGDWLDTAMRLPPVVVYTGHMIDAPGRAEPRFPPSLENTVRAEIHARLERLGPVAAYGSAACGADILCLECIDEMGGELHIVLPFAAEQFRATSVNLQPEGRWGERFERLLEKAKEVLVVSQRPPPVGESIFEYSNLILTGLGRLRAQMLDTDLHGIAVWDGRPAAGEGGTGSITNLWQNSGIPFDHVKVGNGPVDMQPATAVSHLTGAANGSDGTWAFEYKIETMLFADAVGYSRLTEDQIPLFFNYYAGMVADFNANTPYKAVHVETAGDGMYMVFDDPGTAGHYALGLSERMNREDWASKGLPKGLNARIALHCGPVFVGRDPITGLPLYTGNHTSRTARIEPITPPGLVYASSAFAAVAAARDIRSLHFSYIGRTKLAKDFGVLPLYHVK
jgi:class 3 adenylate cyclase